MSDNPVKEVVTDLFQHLEALETRCAALVQLVKEKGVGTEEEFARCEQQASEASSIKWRAARLRMEHLFAIVPEHSDKAPGAQEGHPETKSQDQSKKHSDEAADKSRKKSETVSSPDKQQAKQSQQPKASPGDFAGSKAGSREEERPSQPSESAASQTSEKLRGEIREEEKSATTRTGGFEENGERKQQGGKAGENAA